MKKIVLTILAVTAVLTGCKKTVFPELVSENGTLTLKVSCTRGEYITIGTGDNPMRASENQAAEVDKSNFVVTIYKLEDENGQVSDWKKSWIYSDFPESTELAPGKFKITVSSPEEEKTGWDLPKYYAEEEFSIVENVVTPLELECTLSNMKVTVNLTDNFVGELSDYIISVTADYDSGRESLEWTQADFVNSNTSDKAGYFDVAKLIVTISGHRQVDGSAPNPVTYEIKDVAAMDHHILNIDAVVIGSTEVLKLSVSGRVNEVEQDIDFGGLPEIPVEDEEEEDVTKPEKPYLLWEANPDFLKQTITEQLDADLVIYAAGGIKALNVSVSENFQTIVSGLTGTDADGNKLPHLDLVNDTVLRENLKGFGITALPMGEQVKDQTMVEFPLTDLVLLIPTVGNPGEDYVFTLDLEDNYGQKYSKSLVFFNPAQEGE